MKYTIQLFAAILFCTTISAQINKASISGKLKSKEKISVIHLQNLDGINIPIPVDAANNFSYTAKNITKGFYDVDVIGTVYLAPGYQLTVQPNNDGVYVFKGKGALENNALRTAKKQVSTFLPVNKEGELEQAAYYLDVPVFMQKLDSFQKQGELLFNKSTDTFFQKYAALDLAFYGKHLLYYYSAYYGKDVEKFQKSFELIIKLYSKSPGFAKSIDSLMKSDRKSPGFAKSIDSIMKSGFAKSIDSLMKSANKNKMNSGDRMKLDELIYTNWDKDNDTLFRNSVWYRQAFTTFFSTRVVIDKKYASVQLITIDPDVRTLTVARGEIKNSYILSYFDYTLTSSILKKAKDTAVLNKYYKEYITSASRHDYLLDIKKIYNNRISFADNAPAPEFTYKNVLGKPVSLASLHGKFVYIDVWATWCAPCKAEMPHLKKVEEAYSDKNLEFVSISVDEKENLNEWKEFVKTNGLKGLQLISDNAFNSAFIQKMSINSIPRFILIDPYGKLISANALRPSDKELRTQLDKLL